MFSQLLKKLGLHSSCEDSSESFLNAIGSVSDASLASATVSAIPLTLGFLALNHINPALVEVILRKLGWGYSGAMDEETTLERALIVGEYYQNTAGAIALAQQNQAARHEAQALIDEITKKLAKDFAEAETLIEIPDEFVCPITLSIMVHPMRVETYVGEQKVIHHFDKDAIESWLETNTDNPLNRQVIVSLQADLELKERIQTYISDPANHKRAEVDVTPRIRLE